MNSSYNLISSNIITLDKSNPIINSVTVENGKITGINNPQSHLKSINLQDSTILPGITDSHFHLKNLGKRLEEINLKGVKSIKDILDMVSEKANQLPNGVWIKGFGWDQSLWQNDKFPESIMLDSISDKNPVMLTRVDGHSIWVNKLALKLAGYDVNNPISPEGGKIINNC